MQNTAVNMNGKNTSTVGKLSKVDPHGFERGDDFDYATYEQFESEYLTVLAHRTMRWDKMMKNGTKMKITDGGAVKRFCRKGIPSSYRPMVWMNLSGAQEKMGNSLDLYEKLLETGCSNDLELIELIKTDLDRTFPDNVYFNSKMGDDKRQSLYNILLAYGRRSPEVGYCQGINYVAALILLVVKDEEKSFWLLSTLLDDILPHYYTKSMVSLRAEFKVLEDLVRQKYPECQQVMDEAKVPWMLVASKWFICLFIDVIPIETVLRIWDCLFVEGSKILMRAALCIIHKNQEKLKACRNMPEIVTLFKNIQNDTAMLRCHDFMKNCFETTNPLSKSEIRKLRVKHTETLKQ
nr:growth hormone-regulated TBC protein 1-A-like [Ciona intestinalis]|eukprot:XP_026689407.1 growth hormone-regulated TBC protein 1-A-like [Ciona intestinalis]